MDYVEWLLTNYENTLRWIEEAVANIPDDRFAISLETAPNHPAWTLGHLACSAAFLGQLLGEPFGDVVTAERPMLGAGSKPVSGGIYGTCETLLDRLKERHALLAAAVRAKHNQFADPSPERLRAVAPTVGDIAVYLLASHEHYHLAQINQWKLAAGIRG